MKKDNSDSSFPTHVLSGTEKLAKKLENQTYTPPLENAVNFIEKN